MSTYVFAVPVLPGKTEDLKRYIRETMGPRREDYNRTNQSAGLDIEQFWLQHTPEGDMLIVRWECENPTAIFEQGLHSQDPFDIWFREKIIIECLGVNPDGPMPINELLSNYQNQKTSHKKEERAYQESRKG